jgi:hypothetical protein
MNGSSATNGSSSPTHNGSSKLEDEEAAEIEIPVPWGHISGKNN